MGRTSARLVPQGRQALGDIGSLRCGLNLNLNLNLNLYSQSQWLRIADYGLAALVPPAGAFVPPAGALVPPGGALVPPGGALVPPAGVLVLTEPGGGGASKRYASWRKF